MLYRVTDDGVLYNDYQLKLIDFGCAVDLSKGNGQPWPSFENRPKLSWTNASLEAAKLAKNTLQRHTVSFSDDMFNLALMIAGESSRKT